MTKRAVQQLADDDLLPETNDFRALKRIGAISGFVSSGVPLIDAGRITKAILPSYSQYDGEAPSGIEGLAIDLPRSEIAARPADVNDYWYHRAISRHPEIYRPGKACKNDAIIEIVDRSLVFRSNHWPSRHALNGSRDFFGWIEGFERGEIARVIPITDRLNDFLQHEWPHERNSGIPEQNAFGMRKWNERLAQFEKEANEARDNARGRIVVNVSLAIRIAFDRIAEYRAPGRKGRSS